MEYSQKYANNLINVFSYYNDATIHDVSNMETTFDNHNVFNKLFVVDISTDEIEIPVFARTAIEYTIKDNISRPSLCHIKRIVIPMYVDGVPRTLGRADSIINSFFSQVNFSQRLQKITTTKGLVYYGGRGIILDENFNILLLCTIACRSIELDGEKVMSYYKPIVHISPLVLLRDKRFVDESILKKIIPFYTTHSISFIVSHTYFRSDIPSRTNPQILIDNVNRFIENPVKPSPQRCLNEVLNQTLIDNIDDVLNRFGYGI